MEMLFLLTPPSLTFMVAIVGAFWWAVDSGQCGDLKAPTESILLGPDTPIRDAVSQDETI